MTEPAVRFSGFEYTYPGSGAPALVNVDLEIPAGTFALVAGPSGGGKSTLCRAIVGLVPHLLGGALTGTASTLGIDVTATPPHRLGGKVGYVFQNPEDQVVAQRVENDVAFGPQNLGLPRDVIQRRVDHALRLTGIEALRDRPVDSLSAGQQQRVAIAGALAMNPELLVLDEPTSQLDPGNARQILDFVADLRTTLGMTVVVAEHRLEWCLPHADQIVLVENGRVSSSATRALLARPAPLPAYLNLPPVVRIARGQHRPIEPDRFPLTVEALITEVAERRVGHSRTVCAREGSHPAGGAIPLPLPLGEGRGEGPTDYRQRTPLEAAPSLTLPQRERGLGIPRSPGRAENPLPPKQLGKAERSRQESLRTRLPCQGGEAGAAMGRAAERSASPLIALEDVSFRYPSAALGLPDALQDVSVAFRLGETVGILGVSGSGKTTLVKHLNGLLRPTRGRVLLDGRDTASLPVSQLARRVGFVFQNPLHQLFADSVVSEVALGLRAAGLSAVATADRGRSALGQLGIERLADRHPLSLSEGERRRVAIAAVLAVRPTILVMDEPTLGQDAVERRRLADLMESLASESVCTILVTHEVGFAVEVCDRLVILDEGRLIADGAAGEIGQNLPLLTSAGLVAPQSAEVHDALRRHGVDVKEPTVDAVISALQREVDW